MHASGLALMVLASAGLAGCGSEAAPATEAVQRPVLVALAEAQPASADGGVLATGTVRAKRETALSFISPGRVAAIHVDDGERVARGQLLAQLDPTEVGAGAASARAEAARAQAELRRMQTLADKGWVTRARLEAAQATAAAAQAQVEATGFDVRFARIYAPAPGVVLRRHVEPNQTVAAGTPVVTVGEASGGFVLRAPLADADLARVRVGQGAAVTIPALGAEPLAATVTEVELALPAAPGLRSGLIGEARVRVPGDGGAVAIPASAIWQARADEGFVYVIDPRTQAAKARLVRLGPVGDREVIVTGGLAPGERVVRAGVDKLRDGVRVTTNSRRTPA
jgi:RND family efflux transporter MFP subunit